MKKIVCLVLILSFSFLIFSDSSKKNNSMQLRPPKKNKSCNIETYNQSSVRSLDETRDMSEILHRLKRREDRNKYRNDTLERDDFGYGANNKKTYRK